MSKNPPLFLYETVKKSTYHKTPYQGVFLFPRFKELTLKVCGLIYTIDTIPAKLFFKIDNTGDYTLLSDDNSFKKEDLQKVWESILFYYQKNIQGKARDSQLDLDKKINSLESRLLCIKRIICLLKIERDHELERYLRSVGYQLTEQNFFDDLKKIESLSDMIKLKIEKHNSLLEKKKDNNTSKTTFEDVLLGYLTILGLGFKEANKITLLEYLALEKQVKNKVK